MKHAVISGGNGGLGRALAAGLQANGWHTWLLDLDTHGLETNPQQTPLKCDLTDAQQLAIAMQRIRTEAPSVDLVIYNAGVTHIGAFADLNEAALRRLFEVNFFAATNMACALLQPVRLSQGTHLVISSVAGFAPLHHRTAYAASKHALEGFFSSLRSEEAPYGVTILIAAPSFVSTNTGFAPEAANALTRPGSASDGIDSMTPEAAARIILRGVARQTAFIPVGRIARLSHLIQRLSPRLFRYLMQRNIQGK